MTTTNLTQLSAEELAAELRRREEEKHAAALAREQRLQEAREEWARNTWHAREQVESDLKQQGMDARQAFSEAVRTGDLPGAFTAWMAERVSRYARESARNRAVQAGNAIGDPRAGSIPDLRWYSPDFLKRLEEEADKHARANGYDLADELVPEAPMEVE